MSPFPLSSFPAHPNSSFFDFLNREYPALTPAARWSSIVSPQCSSEDIQKEYRSFMMHGTTVLAIKYEKGVVIAGDRRATEGSQIAARRMEKVFKTDSHSAMAIAGAAGPCVEMAKLFSIELEHYEKLDGVQLSFEGKANRLGQMVKENLPMVMQGLVVIPLFVGYDEIVGQGRIFKYDIVGGRYEEADFHAVGSGGKDARITIKERYRKSMEEEDVIRVVLTALFNAADEDVATGGPDLLRHIYPTLKFVDAQGVRDIEEGYIRTACEELIRTREEQK